MPRTSRSLILIIALTLLPACGSPLQAVQTPTEHATQTFQPAPTLVATTPPSTIPPTLAVPDATPSPTAVPFPDLSAPGPRLLIRPRSSNHLFLLYTPANESLIPFALPERGWIPESRDHFNDHVSPDGRSLVFFQGPTEETGSRTRLRILSLENGMIYPGMVDLSGGYTQDIEAGSSLCHTPVLAWSPDSEFLSLASPASETSWSVSIMEIETGTIRTAAADLGPVKKLAWSPGGGWLLVHANQAGSNCKEGLPDDTDISLYAVPSDSSAALPRLPIFTGSGWSEAGWLTSDHYLIDHRLNGGRADLRMYALQTGQEIRLWPRPFYSLTFDPEQEKVLVSGSLNPDRDPRAGLYTFNRFGQMNRLSETGFNGLQFIGGAQVRWAAFRLEGLIGIGADGVYFPISPHNRGQILPSPDRQWFLVYGEDGADLFTNNGDLVAGLTEHSTSAVLWQPDSAGVIVSSEEGLLYMPVPPAPPIHVNCSLIDCRLSLEAAVWVP